MQLDIVTPTQKVLSEEVDEVVAPTSLGQIAILPHHVNLVTKIVPGELTVKIKNKDQHLAITGGFLEVQNNKVTILADYAIRAEDIEVAKAIEAQKRAEQILKRKKEQVSEKDFAIAEGEMRKSILELKVAGKRRRTI